MDRVERIPMFPLAILPLPGELVPLHIFEPRYRQLLSDLETRDFSFGIFCTHEANKERIGSLMRLESVIKRYPTGESDIVVKCEGTFSLELLFRNFRDKMYPGGDVKIWTGSLTPYPQQTLYEMFVEYLRLRNINKQLTSFNLYEVAQELNLDVNDRYKLLIASDMIREKLLINQVRLQIHLINQERKSKDSYHLN